ncbi:hypothetical protein [Bacillus sp. FJAT-42376]|uniref:hypothetical protein n=1 Tax=Bacillus sp. FJAT-42376 TaxID=2014076 RepID=UPI0013DE404C|nr:hypothetical protein [Bacillus sp. FJAT-42376]
MLQLAVMIAAILFIWMTVSLLKDKWGSELRGKNAWHLLTEEEKEGEIKPYQD